MKSSLGSAMLFFSRAVGLGRIAALLLFFCFVLLPLPAEAGLPRAAVSIPTDQDLSAGLKAAE